MSLSYCFAGRRCRTRSSTRTSPLRFISAPALLLPRNCCQCITPRPVYKYTLCPPRRTRPRLPSFIPTLHPLTRRFTFILHSCCPVRSHGRPDNPPLATEASVSRCPRPPQSASERRMSAESLFKSTMVLSSWLWCDGGGSWSNSWTGCMDRSHSTHLHIISYSDRCSSCHHSVRASLSLSLAHARGSWGGRTRRCRPLQCAAAYSPTYIYCMSR